VGFLGLGEAASELPTVFQLFARRIIVIVGHPCLVVNSTYFIHQGEVEQKISPMFCNMTILGWQQGGS